MKDNIMALYYLLVFFYFGKTFNKKCANDKKTSKFFIYSRYFLFCIIVEKEFILIFRAFRQKV